MAAQQQPAQAFASHLISQTLSSVALLETLNLVSAADAAAIRTRLPDPYKVFPQLAMGNAGGDLAGGMANLSVGNRDAHTQPNANQPTTPAYGQPAAPSYFPVAAPAPPPPAPQNTGSPQAKAIWDYNGTEADDLRFRAGDIIVIDEEVNPQWYRGRVLPQGQGAPPPMEKGGLFPSNYVEKLPDHRSVMPYQTPGAPQPYQAPGAPQPYYPPQQDMSHQQPPPPTTVVVQQDAGDQKHGKFGKMGGKLGNAAVQGAGFGFGASIASNLVNAVL